MNRFPAVSLIAALAVLSLAERALAAPVIVAGDVQLRNDIQLLADRGFITGPVGTWPLSWSPVVRDLERVDQSTLGPAEALAMNRILRHAGRDTRTGELAFNAGIAIGADPALIRAYESTPRGTVSVEGGASFTADRFSMMLNGQYVDSEFDDDEFRADNSLIGVTVGNWALSASTMERWWGPGLDGSLILSNSARPMPAVMLDRTFNDPFESRWLRWLGTWDLSAMFGWLDDERVVDDAKFFGLRFNFRPLPTLEIGVSRTAQWCGSNRPCDADTFLDLLVGRDNRGDGVDAGTEPGNQLAGFDARWTPAFLGRRVGIYGQAIGEDEAGGFPSRYLGLVGLDWAGRMGESWSARVFGEYAGTSCQFHESSKIYNCAYNHTIYQTGYRYQGRSIGHAADNDARMLSLGIALANAEEQEWRILLRSGRLNDGGAPDSGHSVTPTPLKLSSIDLTHGRLFAYGRVELGLGLERTEDPVSGQTQNDTHAFLRWRNTR